MNKEIRNEFLEKQQEYLNKMPYGDFNGRLYTATQNSADVIMKKYKLSRDELINILERK